MFPEGGRTRDPESRMAETLRPGAGWLIAETQPLTVPFYHYRMHRVLPVGTSRPRGGNDISVLIGDPIDCSEV